MGTRVNTVYFKVNNEPRQSAAISTGKSVRNILVLKDVDLIRLRSQCALGTGFQTVSKFNMDRKQINNWHSTHSRSFFFLHKSLGRRIRDAHCAGNTRFISWN